MIKLITKIKIAKINKEITEVEIRLLNAFTSEDYDKYIQLIEKRNELEKI